VSISTNDLKNGMALNLPSEGLVTVVEFQHVKPGKGGAFVRTKLKKVAGGAVLERTFRADEKVPLAVIDKREMQYLYREGGALVFMDTESYDQIHVDTGDLGSMVDYLKEGDGALLHMYNGAVVSAELPAAVELAVSATEPGVQGDRVSGARKPATLETGLVVQVPLFVNTGDRVKVDTRSGEYLSRA
jgi:elongation factor P